MNLLVKDSTRAVVDIHFYRNNDLGIPVMGMKVNYDWYLSNSILILND
jgi:hypothetical protein